MLYQLPNGKTIHLSIEDYLSLTDQDIQYLMSVNAGASVQNPWHGSPISKKSRPYIEEEEPVYEDDPLNGNSYEDDEDIIDHEDLMDDEVDGIDFEIE